MLQQLTPPPAAHIEEPVVRPTTVHVASHLLTPMQGPGVPPAAAPLPPLAPMQGPGVPPAAVPLPPVAPTQGLGVPPVAAPLLPLMPTQGAGVPHVAATISPDTVHTPSEAKEYPNVLSTTAPAADSKMKRLRQKRYQHMQKMTPGTGLSARYSFSSRPFQGPSITADVYHRNMCALDWCVLHPDISKM